MNKLTKNSLNRSVQYQNIQTGRRGEEAVAEQRAANQVLGGDKKPIQHFEEGFFHQTPALDIPSVSIEISLCDKHLWFIH